MRTVVIGFVMLLFCCVSSANAADVKEKFPVKDAMETGEIKALFDGSVKFYWGGQSHPPVAKKFGSFKTSKRTNAFTKSRQSACDWAMAAALDALQKRALREGGNAVINIVSNIKGIEESSATQYSCLAGSMMVNVALKGTVVKLGQDQL